jgi:hypothetical protein
MVVGASGDEDNVTWVCAVDTLVRHPSSPVAGFGRNPGGLSSGRRGRSQ